MIPVAEIFGPTIQGEGPNSGKKCIFVRVVGCDFKCEWCDSKFAWQKDETTKYYIDIDLVNDLLDKCKNTNTNQIILTGGNPCLYNFEKVIDILHQQNILVDIETQGSLFPNWIEKVDTLVISPKAPSSKQPDVYDNIREYVYKHKEQNISIKIPVFNNEDFEFAIRYYHLVNDSRRENLKLYINVGNDNVNEQGDISQRLLLNYAKLIEKVCISDMSNVYVMPQLHTLVWCNKQGV